MRGGSEGVSLSPEPKINLKSFDVIYYLLGNALGFPRAFLPPQPVYLVRVFSVRSLKSEDGNTWSMEKAVKIHPSVTNVKFGISLYPL